MMTGRKPGRAFAVATLTLAIGVALYWPTFRSLAGYWEDTDNLTYTHGYAIAAICAWLLWRARARIDAAGIRPSWWALAPLLGMSFVWYVCWISGIEIGHQALLPLILISAVAATAGIQAARVAAFPVAYLYFAIPVWSLVNNQLQSLTTAGVTLFIRATGLPAYIEGNSVHVPSGGFEIAGGCSGLHFLMVAVAIAVLYGELDRERLRNRVILAVTAALMAIVMNWIRVYTIVVNGHLTDMQGYLVTVDHYKFGWILFGVLLAGYFWAVKRFLPLASVVEGDAAPGSLARGPATAAAIGAAAVAMAVGPVAARAVGLHYAAPETQVLELPDLRGDWTGPSLRSTVWNPVFPDADGEARGSYTTRDGGAVEVYINAYEWQSQARELSGSENDILGVEDWSKIRSLRRSEGVAGGQLDYSELTATGPGGEEWVLVYFYTVGGQKLVGDVAAKIYYAIAALSGRTVSGVVAVAAPCGDDCEAAGAIAKRFIGDNGAALVSTIERGK